MIREEVARKIFLRNDVSPLFFEISKNVSNKSYAVSREEYRGVIYFFIHSSVEDL